MAFPTGWSRRCAITIDADHVGSGGVSDFDVLLTRACLPDEMCSPTDSNAAQANGGDIRFSSDSAGSTQLACDLIAWEKDSSHGADDADILIRVKVPSLSSAADTTIYCWYKAGGSETQPAAGDTYGQHNAYDANVGAYWPAGAGEDRTANNNDLTAAGGLTVGGATLGGMPATDYSGSQYAYAADHASLEPSSLEIAAWVQFDSIATPDGPGLVSKRTNPGVNSYQLYTYSGDLYFHTFGASGAIGGADVSTATRYHIGAVLTASEFKIFRDNVAVNTGTPSGLIGNTTGTLRLGDDHYGNRLDGRMNHVRVEQTGRSTAWRTTRYNNESAPGTFAIAGTPETPGASVQVPFHLIGRRAA